MKMSLVFLEFPQLHWSSIWCHAAVAKGLFNVNGTWNLFFFNNSGVVPPELRDTPWSEEKQNQNKKPQAGEQGVGLEE